LRLFRRGFDRTRIFGSYRDLPGRGRATAAQVTDAALEVLSAHGAGPLVLVLHHFGPHAPYLPPPPHRGRFTPAAADEARRQRAAYHEEVAYLDAELGRLFEDLRRRGRLEDALILLTSDHGEELGEHGRWGHGRSLSDEVL